MNEAISACRFLKVEGSYMRLSPVLTATVLILKLANKRTRQKRKSITFDNLIINAFLACNDDFKLIWAILEPFRRFLNPSVSIQHVEDTILCISDKLSSRKIVN